MRRFDCVLCGSLVPGVTIHDFKMNAKRTEVSWMLCPNHAAIWIMHRLTPDQVLRLRKLAGGDTFHTHEDFYNEKGEHA